MSEWTTEEPEAGRLYWLSIAPEKRQCVGLEPFPVVIKCIVALLSPGHGSVVDGIAPIKHVRDERGGYWRPIDQDWFNGAQWKLVDPDPADPFADKRPSSSRDNDLP